MLALPLAARIAFRDALPRARAAGAAGVLVVAIGWAAWIAPGGLALDPRPDLRQLRAQMYLRSAGPSARPGPCPRAGAERRPCRGVGRGCRAPAPGSRRGSGPALALALMTGIAVPLGAAEVVTEAPIVALFPSEGIPRPTDHPARVILRLADYDRLRGWADAGRARGRPAAWSPPEAAHRVRPLGPGEASVESRLVLEATCQGPWEGRSPWARARDLAARLDGQDAPIAIRPGTGERSWPSPARGGTSWRSAGSSIASPRGPGPGPTCRSCRSRRRGWRWTRRPTSTRPRSTRPGGSCAPRTARSAALWARPAGSPCAGRDARLRRRPPPRGRSRGPCYGTPRRRGIA